jgi:hypothetical protein
MLKCTTKKQDVTGFMRLTIGSSSYEHGNEPSISIDGGEFVYQLRDCQLLRKDFALWSYS